MVSAAFVCWRNWLLVYGVFSSLTRGLVRMRWLRGSNAKGRVNIGQAVGFPMCFRINWKKVLRCDAKVLKVLVNSNPIVVLKRSKEPNIKWLQKIC